MIAQMSVDNILSATNAHGDNLLAYAARRNNIECVKVLLEHVKAHQERSLDDLYSSYSNSETGSFNALYWCVYNGNFDLLTVLIKDSKVDVT
mmetsp:Transcript_9022/g.6362  ORF Transcript_9022/g.6362 Transcript_9022/m.6362 type:complete len:92 (+) Transcript_9022:146-421(+)